MNLKTCRHCDISFHRDDAAPIPHDQCGRCHDEIEARLPPTPNAERPASATTGARNAAGLKFDAGKPRMELLIQGMPRALEAVGAVLTFGAQKYEEHGWQHVEDKHNRYWAAKTRHELARAKGEQRDPETGLLHLAHEACNTLFLLELALLELEQ